MFHTETMVPPPLPSTIPTFIAGGHVDTTNGINGKCEGKRRRSEAELIAPAKNIE